MTDTSKTGLNIIAVSSAVPYSKIKKENKQQPSFSKMLKKAVEETKKSNTDSFSKCIRFINS